MNALHDDLLYLLEAVEIESPTRYRLRGEARDTGETGRATTSGEPESNRLVDSLARAIYDQLYIRPFRSGPPTEIEDIDSDDLTFALSAANTGEGTWEPGWIIQRLEQDGCVVTAKNGVAFWVPPTGLRTGAGEPPRPGEGCRVRVPKERRNQVPGFYVALGDADDEIVDRSVGDPPLLRYYWHLTDRMATTFVDRTTSLMNACKIPFRLKALASARAYTRADAGVLYVSPLYQSQLGPIIAEIYSAVTAGLRRSVPMFTKRLADGLGFAEDPNGSQSFGEHRCQLVADALWQSFCRGEFGRESRAATLASTFVEAGLDPLQPHLGPGSRLESCSFAFPFASLASAASSTAGIENQTETGRGSYPLRSFLETAVRIGTTLCRSAFWDPEGRLCNWIGCTTDGARSGSGTIAVTAEAIGHDVYAGSSGIALFLAQLRERTGDSECGRTASGAIHRSLRQLCHVRPTRQATPISFYCGDLGVAYVARRIGQATRDPELTAASDAILERLTESRLQPHDLDLIGGNAGAIPILLALARSPGLEYCRELAIVLGHELCAKAVQQNVGCAWHRDSESGSGTAPAPLTGFSHGAAGIGLALFELYSATGRADFLKVARSAFDYEDSLFDSRERNWPDLRLKSDRPEFGRFWCHGAPGIALSRLRAAALDPDRADEYLARARLALATTLDAVEQFVESPVSDTSLCHGLSGLGEVVLIASQLLKDPSYQERAITLGRALIDRHAASGEWPSGVPSGGPNPSLMLGLAGVGSWFLRLHDPAGVPSVLLLGS